MLAHLFKVPRVAAVVVVCHRRLDGDTHHLCVRVPVQTACQTHKALANGRYLHLSADSLVEATDATLNHEPALSARYGIERVLYRGRYGIEAASYSAPQPDPRAR